MTPRPISFFSFALHRFDYSDRHRGASRYHTRGPTASNRYMLPETVGIPRLVLGYLFPKVLTWVFPATKRIYTVRNVDNSLSAG